MEMTREEKPALSSLVTETKATWVSPVMTELQLQDAESGNNISENGATGS